MLRDAKVGDKLFSLEYGWGEVTNIQKGNLPLDVKFKTCTAKGVLFKHTKTTGIRCTSIILDDLLIHPRIENKGQ